MVRNTQTTRWLLLTNFLCVFDHFLGLALKGLKAKNNYFEKHMQTTASVDHIPQSW